MSKALDLIAEERQRQIEREGWTPEHDDRHRRGDLAIAAACYAVAHTDARVTHPDADEEGGDYFPWAKKYDKRQKHDTKRALVIAGALIVAELERMERKEKRRK